MKILVTYTVFHSDNYQGGSGKSFEGKALFEIDYEMQAGKVKDYLYERISRESKALAPFDQDFKVSILNMELF